MAVDAFWQNLGSSITGNIPKAYLCVRSADSLSGLVDGSTDYAAVAKSLDKAQKKLLKSSGGVLGGLTASVTEGSANLDDINSRLEGTDYVAMEVQYNPSSISFDTTAGSMDYGGGNAGGESSNMLTRVNNPASTTMSFSLIFDDVNNTNAFMYGQLPTTIGDLMNNVAAWTTMGKGKQYSVTTPVNGLIATLARYETRQVIFYWAKSCFVGEITSVNATYTMFNEQGNPIRANVEVSIRQGYNKMIAYNEKYWDEAFDAAFVKSSSAANLSSGGLQDKILNNSILNLGL